jgi:hypothetical protein
MNELSSPVLDARDAARVYAELLARAPGYVPELNPRAGGPSRALFQIFARYMQAVLDRLNQAPDKNRLAFLDMLGISLIPAQAARAPVVFEVNPASAGGRIEARARLGAKVAGKADPVVFETVNAIALSSAQLRQVATVFPARDEYSDHSLSRAGGRAFTLFRPPQAVRHEIYLAHDTLLAFDGNATVEVEFELSLPAGAPLPIRWEHFDGQAWRTFAGFDPADVSSSQDGTAGLSRSGIVALRAVCGDSKATRVSGIESCWLRGCLDQPLPPDPAFALPQVDRIQLRAVLDRSQSRLLPDAAFADSRAVDVTKTIYPFGQQPQPGSAFFFSCEEAFAKPNAQVALDIQVVPHPPQPSQPPPVTTLTPSVAWEYWDGLRWRTLLQASTPPELFTGDGQVKFAAPPDMMPLTVNGKRGRWIRVRMTGGFYGNRRDLVVSGQVLPVFERVPPALSRFAVNYVFRSPLQAPQHCVTFDDFQYALHSRDVRRAGHPFPVFRPVADALPALYLGFDRPLPNDLVSFYFDVEESVEPLPDLVWECWDGSGFRELRVNDETRNLSRAGIVSFVAPLVASRAQATVARADGSQITTTGAMEAAIFAAGNQVVVRQDDKAELATVAAVQGSQLLLEAPLSESYSGGDISLAALPRFGTPHDWLRARLKLDGAPGEVRVNGIFLNAVTAVQNQTINNELLGSGTGQPGQSLFFTQIPVLEGEEVEIRELEGARAEVELPILREELLGRGFSDDDLRTVTDPRTRRVTEIWVRWRSRPHLFFSGADDRHYVLERARGRLVFGDGTFGRIPISGANSIRARTYRSSGGAAGNVPVGAISQLLSSAPAVGVRNPRAATAGAGGESVAAVADRGADHIRHRDRAVAARDYEAIAKEASAGVALARALPATAPNLRPSGGWVTVIVVPRSGEPRPQPSPELRERVHKYLVERAPATVGSLRIAVIGPTYLPIGVSAKIIPRAAGQQGPVRAAAESAAAAFLHPVTGGPDGKGWPFGRDVFLSDLAAIIEAVEGVDHASNLELLLGDVPAGERVAVPPDRIVAAGSIRMELQLGE